MIGFASGCIAMWALLSLSSDGGHNAVSEGWLKEHAYEKIGR